MNRVLWLLILALLVLHQDNWLWHDARLVGGIVPVTLAYHAMISLAAGAVWWFAVRYCWPVDETESETAA